MDFARPYKSLSTSQLEIEVMEYFDPPTPPINVTCQTIQPAHLQTDVLTTWLTGFIKIWAQTELKHTKKWTIYPERALSQPICSNG